MKQKLIKIRQHMKKYIKKIIYASIIGFVFVLLVNFYVKFRTNALIYNSENQVAKMEVAIVFGAGINGDQPSKYLKDRLDAGITLYKSKKINKILLSGDNGNNEHDELTVMKKYCFENGVDTTKIYVDYAGFDTYSTIYRAKNIFKINEAILISQKYHLNRAIFIGEKIGLKSKGFSANAGDYQNYKYVQAREFLTTFKSFIDVLINRKPRFLGTEININGVSNFSKNDKR
jgi:SanA protein